MEACGFVPDQMRVAPQLHEQYHHAICDSCDWPILGLRFKCLNCPDFDLCGACEDEMQHGHPRSHVFLQLNRFEKKESVFLLLLLTVVQAFARRHGDWKDVQGDVSSPARQ